jgi:DNA-binding response OmpR family regulator
MRILIIEPDEYYHLQFTQTLAELGEILFARRLTHGKKLLAEKSPDVVVMELLLPDGSGYEFLEEARQISGNKQLPIIIFSKVAHLEDIQESLNYGITGYFVKGQDSVNDVKKLLLTI